MLHQCPVCQRSFDEPGFCPYDGTKLAPLDSASKPTVLSAFVAAQPDPDALAMEPTDFGPAPKPPDQVRAISASESRTHAIELLRDRKGPYDHLIGETLDGRYRIERKIGEGGMGVVFAARHAVIERPLAIKVLKHEVMRDLATSQRFVQEAKAASRINHPNIVEVTDFGTTPDGMTYSVMEFVEGETLSKAIKHGAPFQPLRAIRIGIQIARALGTAHDKGIVHRDLKPENVFLTDREGRPDFVKIVDFGIARVMPLEDSGQGPTPRLTRAGSVFGTPEYMAPEQAAGRGDIDQRADIYALGTILYEMLVGRVPHKADNTVQMIAMQMMDPILPPTQVNPDLPIPKSLELLVMKCLAKVREERYQKMSDVQRELDRLAREIEAPAPLPATIVEGTPAPRRGRPTTRQLHEPEFVAGDRPPVLLFPEEAPVARTRSRWPLLVGALLVLGGGSITAFLLTRGGDKPAPVAAHETSPSPADAAVVVQVPLDAAALDAATAVAEVPVDARPAAPRDAGVTIARDPKRKIRIEVLTRPGDAAVYVNGTYRGPGGTTIEEPFGSTVTVNCRAPHFQGTKRVTFDGKVTAIMCTASERIPLCVSGIHNPFDVCDPDPNATTDPMNNP